MVHRALFGSMERFFGILVEHYAGAFPLWLAPEQIRILPITNVQHDRAFELVAELKKAGIRADVDDRSTSIGGKIRKGRNDRIPYMAVIGEKEIESGLLAVRNRKDGELGTLSLEDLIAQINKEVNEKV
jgi:threonyl-tRNA synthetase